MNTDTPNETNQTIWILWEWSVGRRDQKIIGVYASWQSARNEANSRRQADPGKEHDWEEWKISV